MLATAFTHPKYGDDMRWEIWKESYFEQMQRWRCFTQRALFTVQCRYVRASAAHGRPVEVPAKQVALRCALSGNMARNSIVTKAGMAWHGRQGPAAAGTVCPHCGRHLPRCAICKLWPGTPDPRREEAGAWHRGTLRKKLQGLTGPLSTATDDAAAPDDLSIESKFNEM